MVNEMGNNNTSGLREEDNTARDKSQHEVAHADDLKEQNHVFPATLDEDSQRKETVLVSGDLGREDPKGDDQKTEEDNMKTEGKKSLQDAARTDDDKEQNHEVPASEEIYTNEEEMGLGSINLGGVAEPHDDNQKQDEKEQVNNMIPEAKEKSLEEAAFAEEVKGQDHIVPAAEDKNTRGNGTELVSSEPDGIASLNVDNQKQDEKEKDNSAKLVEAKEKSLQESTSTEEIKEQAHLVLAAADKNTHEIETELVSMNPDGMTFPCVDKQKQDEKEEVVNINDEAKEKSSQEASSTDVVERQDHLLSAAEDKNTHGNETGLVSSDPDRTADPHDDNPKKDETEEDNMNAEPQEKPLAKDDQADDIEEKNLIIPKGEDCNNTEAEVELAPGDLMAVGDILDNKTLEGREQGETELHPPAESTKVESRPSEAIEGRETQSASSSKNLEDHEMQQESNFEENLSGTNHHFENQSSTIKEDEGARNSISGAASSTSHDSLPQEPAVLEPELAKIHTEQLVQVCNGPLKNEDRIIPSLTCQDQENGFNLGTSVSPYAVESVFPDPSPEVENEMDDFSVKEMAIEKEKFEVNDADETGNHLGNKTTTMTDLPNGVGVKCNEELPSEMNSIKNDSPESQGEAILSDETQNFLQEVCETEDNSVVLSQKAILVREDSENGNSKQCHYQIQSGGESTEKTNGMGSEEGSKADEPDASLPQFMMNDHQNEEKRCLLDASCDSKSSEDCQFEKAKIIENGHLVEASINYQNEVNEEQQKDTQNEVHLVTDPAVVSNDTFLTDQTYKEEEAEEKKIIEERVQKMEDSNPIGNDTSKRENGEQCKSRSYPIGQAEAFLSPSPFLHALPEKQLQDSDSHMECKKVQNSNESMAELKQESSGEFSITEASSFVIENLTEKNIVSIVEFAKPTPVTMAETKPSVKQSSEQCGIGETPANAIANGDYYQQESVGRLSTESNPDNISIHAQMRKSPSFDLDLRIDAGAEESDQIPLLYQDKTTIESFSSQTDVGDPGKPVALANTEYDKNSLEDEALVVEEKVTLERSDSEKSKTPFLGFLKEEEEADQMLITPKKQQNQSAAKKTTKVSANKEVTSTSTKGKDQKRKPRTSLFGTCMCCATVIN
ncbi:hypothetical protein REPUB_Repub15cG0057400 [Reevesia pubescens]